MRRSPRILLFPLPSVGIHGILLAASWASASIRLPAAWRLADPELGGHSAPRLIWRDVTARRAAVPDQAHDPEWLHRPEPREPAATL